MIKEDIEKIIKKEVSKDYLYDLLHRNGWRKIMLRPKHPKSNKEEQEAFKKKCRIWLPKK